MSSYSTPTRYRYILSFATSCYINCCLTRFGTTESLYPPWMVSFLQLWHLLTLEWARQESARVLTCSLLQCQNSSWTLKFSIVYCPVYLRGSQTNTSNEEYLDPLKLQQCVKRWTVYSILQPHPCSWISASSYTPIVKTLTLPAKNVMQVLKSRIKTESSSSRDMVTICGPVWKSVPVSIHRVCKFWIPFNHCYNIYYKALQSEQFPAHRAAINNPLTISARA